MALSALSLAEPRVADALIEVGCGSGALIRRIARAYDMRQIVGLDVNRFLLNEARRLIQREGLGDRITLREGSAVAIPFPEASFDVVFSSTVMEEVDADRMVAELVRIAKPGGRVVVIVRSVDRPSWSNAGVPEPLRQRIESTAGTGGVGERGCADESLYRRLHEAGLAEIRGGPAWAWTHPGDGWWSNIDHQIRGRLSAEDEVVWGNAIEESQATGLPVWVARPFHCATGMKP
jgi:SAM-dependent methyltransferase